MKVTQSSSSCMKSETIFEWWVEALSMIISHSLIFALSLSSITIFNYLKNLTKVALFTVVEESDAYTVPVDKIAVIRVKGFEHQMLFNVHSFPFAD